MSTSEYHLNKDYQKTLYKKTLFQPIYFKNLRLIHFICWILISLLILCEVNYEYVSVCLISADQMLILAE